MRLNNTIIQVIRAILMALKKVTQSKPNQKWLMENY